MRGHFRAAFVAFLTTSVVVGALAALYNGSTGTTQLVVDVAGWFMGAPAAPSPLGPVTNVIATPSSTSIALTWTNPTKASLTGVMIRRAAGAVAPTSPTTGTLVTDAAKPATSFADTGLTPGTQYSYALFAHEGTPLYATAATVTATTTPTPTLTGWPDATNTGVPAGTTLTKYTGPCTITTAAAVLNSVDASGCSAILIRAKNVTIKNSLTPRIDATDWTGPSVSITDSTVKGGAWSDGSIWGYNITALRVNVTGSQHSVHCAGNCSVTDSWLHDQYNPTGQSYHNNAFITNGGSNMVLKHNTLACTPLLNATDGGCTSNVSLFGDFEPVDNVTVENNLLKANNSSISFCAYGGWEPSKPHPNSTNIKFLNNVFERGANGKCGVYGPVTSFQTTATGNIWSGNTFDDGTAMSP